MIRHFHPAPRSITVTSWLLVGVGLLSGLLAGFTEAVLRRIDATMTAAEFAYVHHPETLARAIPDPNVPSSAYEYAVVVYEAMNNLRDLMAMFIAGVALVPIAYLVRRGLRLGRLAVWIVGVLLAIYVLLALVQDLHLVVPDVVVAKVGSLATTYNLVHQAGLIAIAVAGISAAVAVRTESAREFFGLRYQTTEDDPRLWTIKPPS
jgi:hypothetical protein